MTRKHSERTAPARSPAQTTNRRGRGRPSKRESENIDKRILEAARTCFLANGFKGSTMDSIAERANVTKITLYQRYPDKVALFRDVMRERIRAWSARADQQTGPRGDTLQDRLRYYARSMLRWSRDEEVRAFDALIRASWDCAPSVAEEVEMIRTEKMLSILERDIVQFGSAEGVNCREPRLIAEILLNALTGFSRPLNISNGEFKKASTEFADRLVAILLEGRRAW